MYQNSKSYGADDRVICPKCGQNAVTVTRRMPHPTVIEGEQQTLSCFVCGEESARTVNVEGEVVS
jgi:transcription elongation factor Elf1